MPHPARPSHTPEGRLVIDLHDLPVEGRDFAGGIETDIFALGDRGARPVGPLDYELHVERRGPWLVATGRLGVSFELECVRCLEPFRHRVALDHYLLEDELEENSLSADLTDRVREDILLSLPGYPHCDESNLEQRLCGAARRFQPESAFKSSEADSPDRQRETWSALDKLDLGSAGKAKNPNH